VVEVSAFDTRLLKAPKTYTADSGFKSLSAAIEAEKSLLEKLANSQETEQRTTQQ
jgi:hypothetical protein